MNQSNNTYQLLLNMGEVSREKQWSDYLALGITESDIPELEKLVSDKKLHTSPSDSKEIWVPLHAWRALGQLQSTESCELLLTLQNSILYEDDWALEEIPKVLGMIASEKLTVLQKFLHNKRKKEFARVVAADGIKYVANNHPEKRDQCVALLIDYLENLDKKTEALNGLVVGLLLDLKAVEAIDTIQKVYKADLIDISSAGDIEDVEIELGLRLERDTPKPHNGSIALQKAKKEKDKEKKSNEQVDPIYDLIEGLLLDYGNEESILNVSELDGFFAAIISASNVIPPSQWMPAIWGGEAHSPEWEDFKIVEQFTNSVMGYYNFVANCLLEDEYDPLFLEHEVDNKIHTRTDDWCEGYLKGVNLWPPLSANDASIVTDALEPMNMFATDKGLKQLINMNDTVIEFWQLQIPRSASRIYQYFLQQRQHLRTPVQVNKTGRNDPCPCGSGKKYKKCCLH